MKKPPRYLEGFPKAPNDGAKYVEGEKKPSFWSLLIPRGSISVQGGTRKPSFGCIFDPVVAKISRVKFIEKERFRRSVKGVNGFVEVLK